MFTLMSAVAAVTTYTAAHLWTAAVAGGVVGGLIALFSGPVVVSTFSLAPWLGGAAIVVVIISIVKKILK